MEQLRNDALMDSLLKQSDYLEQFSFPVAEHTRLFRFIPGEYIMKEGNPSDYLFYLAKGRAKLYLTMPNGRVSLIDFFPAPCFIGEMELINDNHETRAVQAIETCYCFALPVCRLKSLLLKDARFLRNLCSLLCKKNYRNIVASSQNQAFPLSNRLADFILLTQHEGIYQENHAQAAEYLGVSYRHLLYVLAQFSKNGLLEKKPHGYRITDKAGLLMLAHEMNPDAVYPQQYT